MRLSAVVLVFASVLFFSTTSHAEEPEGSVPAYRFDYGLFTKPYKANEHGAFFLPSEMKWKVMPQYVGRSDDGKPAVDDRITLILQDTKKGFWPFIAKMDIEEAEALQKSLAAIIAEKRAAKAKAKQIATPRRRQRKRGGGLFVNSRVSLQSPRPGRLNSFVFKVPGTKQ